MRRSPRSVPGVVLLLIGSALALPCLLPAQVAGTAPPDNPQDSTPAQGVTPPQGITQAQVINPQTITLDEAIRRAERNEPNFVAAAAESRALALDRSNARAALLPTAVYHNQVIYTQPNGVPASRIGQTAGAPSPIFIANNSIREYASQGVFNETLGFAQVGAIRLADATAARAAAEAEITRRGLVATVVNLYYGVSAGETRVAVAERARAEAANFLDLTQKREAAREVAHADVLKAQLQAAQRDRDLSDSRLARDRSRLELAVLLFPDVTTPFQTAPAPDPAPLPDRAAVSAAAGARNPEIRSAVASLGVAAAETYSARAALLPDLGLNVTYGIDAPQFATKGVDTGGAQVNNLGYSGSVTLDIPVWDWLTTERRIRQSHIREDAAKVALTNAQRRTLANLAEFYAEAETARAQLASLDASVITARESLRLTNLRYRDGESTALEVVDAQTSLTAAEVAQADGVIRYQLALAQLQTLTGTL